MPPAPDSLAVALADAARAINAPTTLEQTLDAIVHSARASVPGFDQIGISLLTADGTVETLAGTGQVVWDLDALQLRLGEGPGVQATRDEPVVVVDHLRHDQRWPRYVPQAARAGVRAQMALQLFVEDETLGVLNLYSTVNDEIDPDALLAAEPFAAHAALALGRVRRESQLARALSSRTVIGQATGLVMARYQVDAERAFQFIVRASSTSNVKARLVAEEMVSQANRDYSA